MAAVADERAIALGPPKQRAVLAELLLARGAVVGRDELIDAVWGRAAPESAAAALQVYVHGLRRAIGADRIETYGNGYRLRLEPGELDLERFEELVERGRRALADGDAGAAADKLGAAVAIWTGPALADLAGQPVARHAGPLEEQRLQALELRIDADLALGRHERLLGELEALVGDHPYRERLREQQILALYRSGRQKEALDAYRAVRDVFVDELGVEPGPSLRELERRVLRQDPALAAPERQQPGDARLPAPPTALVGRHLEVAAVAALLRRDDVRLVTLTGPGGSGKTRLALAAAAELAPEVAGGAVFADLAPVTDPALLPAVVAQAVGVDSDVGDDAVAGVAAHLRDRALVLVLDNLEQLLPEVTVVAELLAAAPRLRILATSRAPLRLSGEHEYPVPPLPVPARRASFEEAANADAVRLFLARARAVDPSFALTDANLSAVVAICRRLDGLPLALELAAAWTRLLPPEEIEHRLADALGLLVEGARDLPPRQQTLRATLDWSWALLRVEQRAALARLSVFVGGASLEAAEHVLGAGGLAQAAALAEHGLLRRADEDGETRLVLLETIREYALGRLREEEAEPEARRRHADYFRRLAEEAQSQLVEGDVASAMAQLDRDHENLLAAIAWAADDGDVAAEVAMTTSLRLYWVIRGNFAEGRRLLERASSDSAGDPALHAPTLYHAAAFAMRRGNLGAARREWTTALALFEQLGDREEVARCTAELGSVALAEGDLDRAEELYREAAASFAAQGKRYREAAALGNLAGIASERGDWETAVGEGERVVALQRDLGDLEGLGIALHNLARMKLALGRVDDSRRLETEALEVAARLGYLEVIAYGLGTFAELALADGDYELGARLLGHGDALFARLGIARYGEEAKGWERAAAALEHRLGPERRRELAAAGASLTLEQALAEAGAVPVKAPASDP